MPNFGIPADVAKRFSREVKGVATDTLNRIGESVSAVLDVYMRTMFKVSWPIIGELNKHGLHVRRYQMTTILSLGVPAVVSGVLGYVAGRLHRTH